MIRITIGDDKEVEVKTTNGLEETELAMGAVIEIMRQGKPTEASKYELVLTWVNTNIRLRAVKEVHDYMNFELKRAKDCVESCAQGSLIILMAGGKNEVKEVFGKFDNSEAVKVEMRKV